MQWSQALSFLPQVCVWCGEQSPTSREEGVGVFETVGNGIEPPQVHEIRYHLGHNVLVLCQKESQNFQHRRLK